jgi:glycerol kinase
MSSILALDQGTTGSTALVIHQDGRVLGRGYREIPQHFPEPGWVEHDPDDLFDATVAAGRDAVRAAGETPIGLGITNQRGPSSSGIGPPAPGVPDRLAGPADHGALQVLRATAGRPIRQRTGLVLDPYFSATKLEYAQRSRARRAERASRGGDR